MAYKKGESGNLRSRKLGARNKATCELREWVVKLVDSKRGQIHKDFMTLQPRTTGSFKPHLMANSENNTRTKVGRSKCRSVNR